MLFLNIVFANCIATKTVLRSIQGLCGTVLLTARSRSQCYVDQYVVFDSILYFNLQHISEPEHRVSIVSWQTHRRNSPSSLQAGRLLARAASVAHLLDPMAG